MDATPTLVMSFATLDEAESALDWIGLEFTEAESAFEGELVPDDRELLDAAVAEPDTPEPVRELARRLGALLAQGGTAAPAETADGAAAAAWRVAFADS